MFIEYRKLKRSGYTDKMLIEHFGDVIYESGLYNKNASKFNFLKKFNEIKINPTELPYKNWKSNSLFYKNKYDYFAEFETINGNVYSLCLMYYEIDNLSTYNILFTTKEKMDKYSSELNKILLSKGSISNNDREYLKSIFEKETNLNEIIDIMKRISFIIFDMYKSNIKNKLLSIGDTDNYRKIKLYRSIIKDSFDNINEEEIIDSYGNKYFVYEIKD